MKSIICCKLKTAYEVRISDWSSDVCSSDLNGGYGRYRGQSAFDSAFFVATALPETYQTRGPSMNIRMIVLTVAIATSFIQGIGDAVAACSSDDFKITSFEPSEKDRAGGRKVYSLKGVLVNNCAEAAAAELKVDAKNDGGEIIHTESGWPAGSNNIAPGASAEFDLGPLFRYNDKIKYFGVSISSTKSW